MDAVRQFVVGSIADVPRDFVPIADYGGRASGKSGTPPYELLLNAWQARRISGCKVMRTPTDKAGPVYVDKAQAEAMLRSIRDTKATLEQQAAADATATAIDGAGIVSALRSMLFELRRIGNTLETLSQRAALVEAATITEDKAGEWDSPDR